MADWSGSPLVGSIEVHGRRSTAHCVSRLDPDKRISIRDRALSSTSDNRLRLSMSPNSSKKSHDYEYTHEQGTTCWTETPHDLTSTRSDRIDVQDNEDSERQHHHRNPGAVNVEIHPTCVSRSSEQKTVAAIPVYKLSVEVFRP